MKHFWDERYSSELYIYGEKPNRFFFGELEKLPVGKLLLPGEGEGRNAVWAASKGWEVYALDYSNEARRKALALAKKNNVKLRDYALTDLETVNLPENHYDAIATVFLHLEPELRKDFHKKIIRSLKPGGHLIIEAFRKDQLSFQSGGPKNPDLLYSIEIFNFDFNEMEIIFLTETNETLNEGDHHSGEAALVRLVARKHPTG